MLDRALTLDELLCFSLYSANHAMGRLYRPLLARFDLTYPQYLVLVALWQQDGRKVSDLGTELQLESNTLTPLLKRMEAAGLLRRARNPQDERSVIVTLTDKGRALEGEAADISNCILAAADADLAELAELRDRLHRLTARLREAG
ncbi:MarR family winged helix-turn-helix transcriptional regulator [Ruegeria aquimaris]|uniref:MarR family transcriptional regulator n=1 Tax=Ruegeria aquimaris TaxID=2984333 RepID=A0ABT3AQ09_9RHOB|nr:MarR family transcriptional regulator [Ruegeria sp. XHP0148]MCV2890748.1 MarR family transcriptional regulator [Ruegeria sp. XHP0148]